MVLRRNILILHGGALGDFVLTWPLAAALGRIFAQSRVIYVTTGQKGKLAERVLGVESADVESGWHHLYADPAQLPERPTRLLAGAQVIISFQPVSDDRTADILARLCPQALVIPIRLPPREQMTRPLHQLMLDELSPWPVMREGLGQMLRSVADRGLGSKPAATDGVVIHPGSSRAAKCWPVDRFADLARRLRGAGRRVRFVLGEVELERWPAADVAMLGGVADLHRPATLLDLWQQLHTADAFVGNDSGPAHLAGIIGRPTLTLFGPTDPDIWRPLGPHVKTIRSDDLASLAVDEVYQQLETPQ